MSVISSVRPGQAVAIGRIVVGAAALLKAAIMAPVLLGLADPAAIRIPMTSWLPFLPGAAMVPVLVAWTGTGLAFLGGWHTRVAGTLLSITLLGVLLGDQQLYSNHLYLLLTVVFLLTLASAGAQWSVTLLRLQVSIVYGFAAVSKLNLVFLSGAVLTAFIGRGALLPFPTAARTFPVMASLSWLAILTELFLAGFIWSVKLRPMVITLGVAFHLTIILFVGPWAELVVFALLMFALYVVHLGRVVGSGPSAGSEDR